MTAKPLPTRRLIVLGATGSIGVNTLAVVEHLRACGLARFEVVGLASGSRCEAVCDQARSFAVPHIAVASDQDHACLRSVNAKVFRGADAALEMVHAIAKPGDLVVGAMVGSAGIPAVIAAVERGCDIALANKETLVAAGALVMPLVRAKGVHLLPVDSEHSAIFQCLGTCEDLSHVARIILTASGGPFRTWPTDRIARATPDEALNHPTWNMGPKVTIDSASLMNKALEIIEAHWLFDAPAEKIDVIIHPQSVVHGMVEFCDGSVMAQLSPPDMKTPIQYALTWPDRCEGVSRRVDWTAIRALEFEPLDERRFEAPSLARRVIELGNTGGTAGAVINAANEAAVQAFLDRRIPFGRIVEVVHDAFDAIRFRPVHTMQDVLAADAEARMFVRERLAKAQSWTVSVLP